MLKFKFYEKVKKLKKSSFCLFYISIITENPVVVKGLGVTLRTVIHRVDF